MKMRLNDRVAFASCSPNFWRRAFGTILRAESDDRTGAQLYPRHVLNERKCKVLLGI